MQIDYLEQSLNEFLQSVGTYLSMIVMATTGTLTTIGIILIYIFFFMFYRSKFKNFLLMITPSGKHEKTNLIITQISYVTQQYLSGVLIVVVILAVLNSVGLIIISIRHALFFGILAGILNIIPYIGSFLGGLLPFVMALLTRESWGPAIAVACVFAFNQFMENNFLTPHIVGGKVKVNPLATIIALLIGGYLWGVAGMIMFIPFLGIAKIIFDNIETLNPYGYLIGEETNTSGIAANKMREWIKKKIPVNNG
jgi:predicted PurR-regulated permease PerM